MKIHSFLDCFRQVSTGSGYGRGEVNCSVFPKMLCTNVVATKQDGFQEN